MDEPEIRYLGDVQRLTLNPGDILVLSTDRQLPIEACERLRDHMKQLVGDRKVIVISDGLRLGVLAEEKA